MFLSEFKEVVNYQNSLILIDESCSNNIRKKSIDDEVEYKYYVDGDKTPFDKNAKEWFATVLPMLAMLIREQGEV